MVDIARDARWGRIVEGAGEDPYLGSAMAPRASSRFSGRGSERGGQSPRMRKTLRCIRRRGRRRDYDSSLRSRKLLFATFICAIPCCRKRGGRLSDERVHGFERRSRHWQPFHAFTTFFAANALPGILFVTDALAAGDLVTHGYARDRKDAPIFAFNAGVNVDMASQTLSKNRLQKR